MWWGPGAPWRRPPTTCRALHPWPQLCSRSLRPGGGGQWWDVGILILLGFLGTLRPGEMLRLRPADILPPSVLLLPTLTAYVSICDPKQERTTARREHALVEDAAFVAFLEEWLACHSAPTRKIFKGKASDFRKCFLTHWCASLGLSRAMAKGSPPLRCVAEGPLGSSSRLVRPSCPAGAGGGTKSETLKFMSKRWQRSPCCRRCLSPSALGYASLLVPHL